LKVVTILRRGEYRSKTIGGLGATSRRGQGMGEERGLLKGCRKNAERIRGKKLRVYWDYLRSEGGVRVSIESRSGLRNGGRLVALGVDLPWVRLSFTVWGDVGKSIKKMRGLVIGRKTKTFDFGEVGRSHPRYFPGLRFYEERRTFVQGLWAPKRNRRRPILIRGTARLVWRKTDGKRSSGEGKGWGRGPKIVTRIAE